MNHPTNGSSISVSSKRPPCISVGGRPRFTFKRAVNLDLLLDQLRSQTTNGNSCPVYFTFGGLVEELLYTFELLIDSDSLHSRGGDGIEISQTLDVRKNVVGFDLLDIIDPATSITPRVKYLDALGDGWCDLAHSMKSLVIFGRGFGEPIMPNHYQSPTCLSWSSLSLHRDYLGASVSTLQMLYQKQFIRENPHLARGQLRKDTTWFSPNATP